MCRINGALISDDEHADFIRAWLWDMKSSSNRLLDISISTVVDTKTDPMGCCTPVFDFLETVCAHEAEWGRFESPSYFGGEVFDTTLTVYEACPGSDIDHLCKQRGFSKLTR